MYKIIVVILLFSFTAQAKIFRNSYVSFELSKKWSCKLENTSWVCTNSSKSRGVNTAIIILTAKEKGPTDSLSLYETYLGKPVTIKTTSGPKVSKILNVSQRKINHHLWIDSLHQGSESLNFWTRYLATTHGNIAILVTFSSHKNFYTKYSNGFIKSIQSLRLVNQGSSKFRPGELRGVNESLGAPVAELLSNNINIPNEPVLQKKKNTKGKIIGLLFLLCAAILVWYKKRKF
ncbi:MAG: hypothetical protein HAW63_00705 [Bdellovibrionaceae bacterium]|nr:hypothetical protein [Pseudobdellovibrionaceae bacterium]